MHQLPSLAHSPAAAPGHILHAQYMDPPLLVKFTNTITHHTPESISRSSLSSAGVVTVVSDAIVVASTRCETLTLSRGSSVLSISSFGMESKARMEAVPFCLLLVPMHGFELRYLTQCGF